MRKDERGLTLIEIIMALAIAGLLAATVFTGRDHLRSQIQFSEAIDQIVQVLTTARGEASGTVGNAYDLPAAGQGDTPLTATPFHNQQIIGKFVSFKRGIGAPGPDYAKVATALEDETTGLVDHVDFDEYQVTLPWQVQVNNSQLNGSCGGATVGSSNSGFVLFYLGPNNSVQVYRNLTGAMAGQNVGALTPLPAGCQMELDFKDKSGQSASVFIDSFGNVTRTIN